MKRILFILLLFVAVAAKGQTNVYHPFPDSDAVWNVGWTHYDQGVVTCTETGEWSYMIKGDTLINSFTYHKIYIPYIHWISGFCVITPPCQKGYAGAFREDTLNRKVWLIFPDSTIERVLYDFNLNVGDSVRLSYTDCFQNISSIDSVLIGTNYRKRWKLSSNPFDFFIEGIGSSTGLLGNAGSGSLCSPFDQGDWTTLLCFQQNGRNLYPDSSTFCNLITGVKDTPPSHIEAILSPNPFHTSATLEIKNEELKIKNLEMKVYNTMGRLIRTITLEKGRGEVIIPRGDLSDGLYFYQLVSENGETVAGKFVVE